MAALSKYLNAELVRRDWTVAEFVDRAEREKRQPGAGLSLSNAYLILRDGKDNVQLETFELIARTLGMTPAELMVAIGKGHAAEDPKRARLVALMRDVPDDTFDTVETLVRALTRAKNDSGVIAKTRRPDANGT